MHNNIVGKAAFSNRYLSLLGSAKPNPLHERINFFMRIFFLVLIHFIFVGIHSTFAQICDFPELTNGCECESAVVVCNSEIDGFVGTLPAQDCGVQPPTFCDGSGSIENPIWFSFVALSNTVDILITPSGCSQGMGGFIGMQAAVYADCGDDDTFICAGNGTEDPISIMATNFTVGQTYYLIIDGYGGSICDFTIDAIEGVSSTQLDLSTQGQNEISGETGSVCVEDGEIFTFTVPDCEVSGSSTFVNLWENGWTCYDWTITPDTYTLVGDENTPFLQVQFTEKANYTISVERFLHPNIEECATGSCDNPEPIDLTVCIIDTVYDSTVLCPGEFKEICGDQIGVPGVYSCLDEANCTMLIDTIIIMNPEVEELGNIFLCPDQCFELEGEMYCDRIDYNIQSTMDCNKAYTFSIKNLSVTIIPDEYPIVDCNGGEEIVSHTVNTNYDGDLNLQYLDETGAEISTSNFVLVTQPGDYKFIVYVEGFETSCSDTVEFTIEIDDTEVDFDLTADLLTCSDQESLVEIITTENIVSYSWSGPNIQGANNESSITAIDSGTYIVTVEGENGCTTQKEVFVDANYPPIDVEVNYEELDCKIAQTTLSYISSLDIDSILWAGPNEFKGRTEEIIAIDTGVYVLNLFASNGCDYSHIFKVLGNYTNPEFTAIVPPEWACKSEMLDLEIDFEVTSNYSVNWSTDEGIIIGDIESKTLTVGSTGEYFVEVTDDFTGCSILDTILVVANDEVPTSIDIESVSPLCFDINDGTIDVLDIEGGTGPFDIYLNGNIQSSGFIENLAPANYEIMAVDVNGCEVKRQVMISAPDELLADISGPSEANYGDNVIIESSVDQVQFDIDIINWYDELGMYLGSGDDVQFVMEKNTVITMEVIDQNGCIVLRTLPVLLDEDYDYFVPTIFTPNQDGFNDYFAIFTQNLPGKIEGLYVYDRWGNQVFEATDIENGIQDPSWGWDGLYNGQAVNSGVYVYYAEVETLGVKKQLKGSVTLVR